MHPILTGEAYDEITHLWRSDSFNKENGMAQHKKSLAFVDARGGALDVGCGCTGRFAEFLSKEGFVYEGLDVSGEMINLARRQYPNITFYHENICEWSIPRKYDFITAWDSLWHVPLEQHEQVISKLVSALSTDGVFVFSFGGADEPDEHTNELMGPEIYYATLGTNSYLQLIADRGCICMHLEFDQYPESHAYMIVKKSDA